MTTKCNTHFWTGSICYKGYYWDNRGNWNRFENSAVTMINTKVLNLMVTQWLGRRMPLREIHARLSGVMSGMIRLQSDNLFSNSFQGKSSLYCTWKCFVMMRLFKTKSACGRNLTRLKSIIIMIQSIYLLCPLLYCLFSLSFPSLFPSFLLLLHPLPCFPFSFLPSFSFSAFCF